MKKIFLSSFFAVAISISAIAQAVLPTTWDFATTTLPTGWSETNVNSTTPPYYTGSGNPAPAYKFDAAGDKLTIDFTTLPGNLKYDIKANVATPPGNPFSGTFLVEESANGTTWTTLHSHTTMSITAYTTTTDIPQSTTRHIRFNFTAKTNGNVSIDNVSIVAGVSTAAQITVKQGTTTILNGGTYTLGSPVSTMAPTTFTIQNLGTVGALDVTAATISGAAAADFSVATAMPVNVAASGTGSLIVNFTPSASGTRNATLSLTNNDATANPYIINLNGIGGNLATEPSVQATNMTFPYTKTFHISGVYTAASPAVDGYLVLRRTGATITDVPVDGIIYQRGDMIGNSKVVYSSSATGFFPNDIVANTTYYFAVFAYNGVGTFRNYLTTAPLLGNITTPASSPLSTTYYNSILTTNSTFVSDLHALINPHVLQFYSSYGPLMASTIYTRDTTANQRVITCVYSGENKVYTEPWDWTTYNFSREHTYCSSWQPTVNDANFQNRPEYNDYHMLTPTNQNDVNAVRSNYPLGKVVGTPSSSSYLADKVGNDINGRKVFEPRDAHKGDAARCMLYECITYTGVPFSGPAGTPGCTWGGSWSLPANISNSITYGQDQSILKLWNIQDPPDNFEIARNDYVDSLQHNRNPFIDHPEYVCYIDFSTMTMIPNPPNPCDAIGVSENQKNEDLISISPNPSSGSFLLNYTATQNQKLSIKLVDMVGRIVYTNEVKVSNGNNPIQLNIPNLNAGIYLFELTNEQGKQTKKLVIE